MVYRSEQKARKAHKQILNKLENLEADLDLALNLHGADTPEVTRLEDKICIKRHQAIHAEKEISAYAQINNAK